MAQERPAYIQIHVYMPTSLHMYMLTKQCMCLPLSMFSTIADGKGRPHEEGMTGSVLCVVRDTASAALGISSGPATHSQREQTAYSEDQQL